MNLFVFLFLAVILFVLLDSLRKPSASKKKLAPSHPPRLPALPDNLVPEAVPRPRQSELRQELGYLYQEIGEPGPLFQSDPALARRIQSRSGVDTALQGLMADMFRHMGLPAPPVSLKVVQSPNDSFGRVPERPGAYRQSGYTSKEINLTIKRDYGYWNIAAVLAHECCHFYMYDRGIVARPGRDNELLTDMTAVFLGFGEIMEYGYAPLTKQEGGLTRTSRLGYLKWEEIMLLRQMLQERPTAPDPVEIPAQAPPAGEEQALREQNRLMVERRAQAGGKLETAYQLLQGYLLMTSISRGRSDLDLEEYQEAVNHRYEGFQEELEGLGDALKEARDLEALAAVEQQLDSLSQEIEAQNGQMMQL